MISAFIRNKVYRYIGENNQQQSYLAEALQDPWGKKIHICIVGQYNQLGRPQSCGGHHKLNRLIPQSVNSTTEANQVQANRRDLRLRERGFTPYPLIRNIRQHYADSRATFSMTSSPCAIPQRVHNSNMTSSFVAFFTTTVQRYIHLPLQPGVIAQRFDRDHPAMYTARSQAQISHTPHPPIVPSQLRIHAFTSNSTKSTQSSS